MVNICSLVQFCRIPMLGLDKYLPKFCVVVLLKNCLEINGTET